MRFPHNKNFNRSPVNSLHNHDPNASTCLGSGDEDGLLADLRPVEGLARLDVEHEQVAHLGDHEDDVVLRAHLATAK